MGAFVFIVTILFTILATKGRTQATTSSPCKGTEQLVQLNFDDVLCDNPTITYIALPIPYKNFILRRINPINPNGLYPMILKNTTNDARFASFNAATTTPPNIIFSDVYMLNLSATVKTSFTVLNFTLSSIWWTPLPVQIQGFRKGALVHTQNHNLSETTPLTIIMPPQLNIDVLTVNSTDESVPLGNRFIAYDSFNICQ